VIGHHDVAYHHEPIALADFFEDGQKQIAPLGARQPRLSMITAASDEMQLLGAVIAAGMVGHRARLRVAAKKSCDIRPCRSHLYKKRKGGPATLGISLDELLHPKAKKLASKQPSRRVLRRLEQIERLPRRKQIALLTTIDAFLQAAESAAAS
jgi:hypothetical protein